SANSPSCRNASAVKSMSTLTPEALYLQLGRLIAEMPDLAAKGPVTAEMNQWVGRAIVLVEETGDTVGLATIRASALTLAEPLLRAMHAQSIAAVLYTALAKAELAAPAPVQGAFIAAGHGFDAFAAVSKVMSTATSDVLMIDPYAD